MSDTIFALSSGSPPAAIAVVRISGPHAAEALSALIGSVPPPRRAALRELRDRQGHLLDRGLVLWFPGPGSATGEDAAELHLHGGRAVVRAVEEALDHLPGLRRAAPGEFTRRAFFNGRIDLAEAEGLADLIHAETELQRRSALAMAGGDFSRIVERWRDQVLLLSASLEAHLDFADEDDASQMPPAFAQTVATLAAELREWLGRPRAEQLRDGFRVVIAGPPNAGKSTLFNAMLGTEAAIVTSVPGTTRDVLSRPIAIEGIPITLVDTAGLRSETGDQIEVLGMERAKAETLTADLVLWLGDEDQAPEGSWSIEAQIDRADHAVKVRPHHRLSAKTGEGVASLMRDLAREAATTMPAPGEAALNQRQAAFLAEAEVALHDAADRSDLLIKADALRRCRVTFDRLIGRSGIENMLDSLFGRFCIGK